MRRREKEERRGEEEGGGGGGEMRKMGKEAGFLQKPRQPFHIPQCVFIHLTFTWKSHWRRLPPQET